MGSVDCAAYNHISVHRKDKQQILMFAVYWGRHLSVSLEEEKCWWKWKKSTAKMKQKLQAFFTIKKHLFFDLWFPRKILRYLTSHHHCYKSPWTLQMPCLTGGRDWHNQVEYQGISKEFLKNMHIFWKKMMHQNVARAHGDDYSALLHG